MKQSRFSLIFLLLGLFLTISFGIRTTLLLKSFTHLDLTFFALIKIYLVGAMYDLIAFSYYIAPFALYLILMPKKLFNTKIHKYFLWLIILAQIYAFIFAGVSEWFFWEEFGKRFNFIAVDYLVYTHEVINNILESYPVPLLVSIVFIISLSVFYLLYKNSSSLQFAFLSQEKFLQRVKKGFIFLLLPFVLFAVFNKQSISHITKNSYENELAKNGFYSLFSAFRNNTLDYNEFYKNEDIQAVMQKLYKLNGFNDTKEKTVATSGTIKKPNVILIMVESLSAEYLGAFGDTRGLTPHLDALSKKSLFFDNLYATGTRTVRGMEAVTLSLPPTPGRSIVKRPDNANMFSTGFIFKNKGYENKFIYAGHGYFDNMNSFFGNNGFKTVDRTDFNDSEVTFSNVWGVCDEDLLHKVLKESDKSYADKKPFFNFVMTTSNHRPFTYPNGKIDIPSHTGRDGGVKYTDFAINQFLQEAKQKPWFDNTLFVIIADHNGGSAGKTELPVWRYKIPFIVYAPKLIQAQTIHKVASQVDVMPTLFSLFHWNYKSMFYGNNILSKNFVQRAFIGNYQKLGFLKDNKLTILEPNKSVNEFEVLNQTLYSNQYKPIPVNKEDEQEAIAYYQSASYMYKHKLDRYKR
jgi:phosphoglycerol transferase MdoB-like AlkP superfamily enzyme